MASLATGVMGNNSARNFSESKLPSSNNYLLANSILQSQEKRKKYSYKGDEIDLEYFIQNLVTNLNKYLDSKKGVWSSGRLKDFREYFSKYMDALAEGRLSTDWNGTIEDSKGGGELHNRYIMLLEDGRRVTGTEYKALKRRDRSHIIDVYDSPGDVAYYFEWIADAQYKQELKDRGLSN